MKKLISYWREILILSLLVWVIIAKRNDAHCDTCYNKIKEIDMIINEEIIWKGFDALSFSEAFNQMYNQYGQGHIFDWRGKVYLTNLKEGE